ncbi:rod shape-determining protein RodA [Moorena sp. SIO3I8]|uniref:rod shape-determining protein RodA n=2 Tax=unclassified Moorena TaxID=2683338 RepID=UPI0013BF04E6|nr:rod shape-determining protein RodA [Moorena sp. SIO3I8]NEO04648.1 rod shape-determining protein RodA [Moorena sp. SIO3I8]
MVQINKFNKFRIRNSIRWRLFWAPWQELDWQLLFLTVGLTLFGAVMIRSAAIDNPENYWLSHLLIGSIGLFFALFISRSRYQSLIQWHWLIYGITNLSLIAVMMIGASAKGAQRWVTIGGFNVQPSEFAKIGLIITLAAILHKRPATTIPAVIAALAVTILPWALVFGQPDLGTSLVFGAITLSMLYWANANPAWLVVLISPLVSAIVFSISSPAWYTWAAVITLIAFLSLPWRWLGALGTLVVNLVVGPLGKVFWNLLKDYQKDRLTLFLNPDLDPLGGGYHLIQSRIGIGAGQLWGRGLNQGTQTQLHFIPEQHTDFIFSAIGEELGFVGCLCILLALWWLCLRLVLIAQNAKDNFGSLVTIGVLSMIVFQTVINIGMTIGLAPITGIPLPLLSYGRSALLTNFLGLGLAQAVANYRQRLKFQ